VSTRNEEEPVNAIVRLEHSLLAVEMEQTVNAMLDLEAPSAPRTDRAPLDLALALDRSGSMAGPKLDAVKQSAAYLVRRLGRDDRLALVTYDDEVELVTALGEPEKEDLIEVIQGIMSGGGTNLSGGWLKAVEALLAAPARSDADDAAGPATAPPIRRVLLLTDGQANVGIMDADTLVCMAGNAATDGITTTTIGFGEDFDEDLLTGIASAGRGNAHYVADPDRTPGVFGHEFDGLVSLVAQNVAVEIHPSDHVATVGVMNGYAQVSVPGGVQVQLGDAYADERRRVVFELAIPGLEEIGVTQVAEIVVRWIALGEQIAAHSRRIPLVVNAVTADEARAAEADPEVVEEVLVLKAARAQREAILRADAGDFDGARSVLAGAADELRQSASLSGATRSAELLSQAEDLESSSASMNRPAYDSRARKLLRYRSHEGGRRRGL
jgi:Ca-activated chloride channel family protein